MTVWLWRQKGLSVLRRKRLTPLSHPMHSAIFPPCIYRRSRHSRADGRFATTAREYYLFAIAMLGLPTPFAVRDRLPDIGPERSPHPLLCDHFGTTFTWPLAAS